MAQANPADHDFGATSAAAVADQRDDAMPKRLRPSAATAHATLGAVLVAQTRPHEAINVLESGRRYVSEHPSFDHVRWILTQAHLCAAAQKFRAIRADLVRERQLDPKARERDDPRLDAIAAHRESARPLLDIIRAHERTRESPAFAGRTDISRSDEICREDWLSTLTTKAGYRVVYEVKQKEEPGSYRALCRWLGVRMDPPESRSYKEEEPVFLHVWGGTVNERVQVAGLERDPGEGREGTRRQNVVPVTPTGKPFYYFAQLEKLEDAAYVPVSLPVPLKEPRLGESGVTPPSPNPTSGVAEISTPPASDPPQRETESRCPGIKNLIRLTFDPIVPASARSTLDE
jgi:hypothetical protein